MEPGQQQSPVTLEYESRSRPKPVKQPYTGSGAVFNGLFDLVLGVLLAIIAVGNVIDFLQRGQFPDLSTGAALSFAAALLLFRAIFALWMHGRALRGLPTYSAWRTLGRVIRCFASFITG